MYLKQLPVCASATPQLSTSTGGYEAILAFTSVWVRFRLSRTELPKKRGANAIKQKETAGWTTGGNVSSQVFGQLHFHFCVCWDAEEDRMDLRPLRPCPPQHLHKGLLASGHSFHQCCLKLQVTHSLFMSNQIFYILKITEIKRACRIFHPLFLTNSRLCLFRSIQRFNDV